jgi:hypothetical protein
MYTFIVAYHERAGTRVTLKNHLLVLRKKKNNSEGGPAAAVELEVIGVIRTRVSSRTALWLSSEVIDRIPPPFSFFSRIVTGRSYQNLLTARSCFLPQRSRNHAADLICITLA